MPDETLSSAGYPPPSSQNVPNPLPHFLGSHCQLGDILALLMIRFCKVGRNLEVDSKFSTR